MKETGNKKAKANKKKTCHRQRTAVKGRNGVMYWTLYAFFFVFVRPFINIEIKNNVGKLRKPCIVLCNHGSFFDFFYTAIAIGRYNPRYIANRMYFYKKFNAFMLRSVGCFPKSMFSADIDSAKECVRLMKNGEMLIMMPEARLSTVGKFEDIQPSTIKFVQKMNVDVYTFKLRGDYFAKPKWGSRMLWRSPVTCEIGQLFAADETSKLSFDEVAARTAENIDYNEFEWIKTRPDVAYKSKNLAKGLENILFLCPKCHKMHTIMTQGNRIYCTECGYSVMLNKRYGFDGGEFENFQIWYDYQKEWLRNEIKNMGGNYVLKDEVILNHSCKNGRHTLEKAGNGVCTLDKNGLTYKGTEYGKDIEKFFRLEDFYRLLFGAGEDFELYEGSEIWYFQPGDRRTCVVWYVAGELLKEIYG